MRWVDRGPEPGEVAGYAQQYTQGWIDHFQNRTGRRPADFLWAVFRPLLGSRTNNICWYCEQQCYAGAESGGYTPTIDHFRPLSRFPQLAYEWSNWVFSCQRCNDLKGNKWPQSGYVDPCADDVMERPEQYFDYDVATGELIPKAGLTGTARRKAWDTINDLGLNQWLLISLREERIRAFIAELLLTPTDDRETFVTSQTEQPAEYAGAVGMVVEQLRQDGYI